MPEEYKQHAESRAEEKKLEKPVEEEIDSSEKDKEISNLKQDKDSESVEQTNKRSQSAQKIEDTNKKQDKKSEEKKEDKKPVEPVVKGKKKEAVVNGKDLRISTKHSVAICNFIRGQEIDKAINKLEDVVKMKRAVPMKGEIPHRHGKIMSGRYPVKASEVFIRLLKSLKSNAIANELELEKVKIVCKANVAARPHRRFGQSRFKRSHVEIKLVEFKKKVKKKKINKEVKR